MTIENKNAFNNYFPSIKNPNDKLLIVFSFAAVFLPINESINLTLLNKYIHNKKQEIIKMILLK